MADQGNDAFVTELDKAEAEEREQLQRIREAIASGRESGKEAIHREMVADNAKVVEQNGARMLAERQAALKEVQQQREAPPRSQEPAGVTADKAESQAPTLAFYEDGTRTPRSYDELKREHAEGPAKETDSQSQAKGQGDGRTLNFYEDRNPEQSRTR